MTLAGTPVCHISVGKWMRADGDYVPQHAPLYYLLANGITSQNNCMDCHGHDIPGTYTYPSLKK